MKLKRRSIIAWYHPINFDHVLMIMALLTQLLNTISETMQGPFVPNQTCALRTGIAQSLEAILVIIGGLQLDVPISGKDQALDKEETSGAYKGVMLRFIGYDPVILFETYLYLMKRLQRRHPITTEEKHLIKVIQGCLGPDINTIQMNETVPSGSTDSNWRIQKMEWMQYKESGRKSTISENNIYRHIESMLKLVKPLEKAALQLSQSLIEGASAESEMIADLIKALDSRVIVHNMVCIPFMIMIILCV